MCSSQPPSGRDVELGVVETGPTDREVTFRRSKEQAIILLVGMEHQPVAKQLAALLNDSEGEVFATAAWGLRKLKAVDQFPAMLRRASDMEEILRESLRNPGGNPWKIVEKSFGNPGEILRKSFGNTRGIFGTTLGNTGDIIGKSMGNYREILRELCKFTLSVKISSKVGGGAASSESNF